MAFVVTENCIRCKYTDCVEVCPVDCFYEGDLMLVIHPDECIDCGYCEPVCPAEAIVQEDEAPFDIDWHAFNLEKAERWPKINIKKAAPVDAAKWLNVKDKLRFIKP